MPLNISILENEDVSSELVQKLKDIEQEAVAVFTPPFHSSEIAELLESIAQILILTPNITKSILKTALIEVWDYFDEKYSIVDKLDEVIKLPAVLEPFDSIAIRVAVKQAIIPIIVGQINIPD
jgi:hypothetical protein